MDKYKKLATPPKDALKPITGHPKLNGKTDINPQWRYEALTEVYGEYGQGWYIEVVNTFTQPVEATHELLLYALVNLYVKQGEEWSKPAPGFGGDYIIRKFKSGLSGNDEAYKMAVTDAIGTAAKLFGVAADVYRGKLNGSSDSKYSRYGENTQAPIQNTRQQQKTPQNLNLSEEGQLLAKLKAVQKEHSFSNDDIKMMMHEKFNKGGWRELSIEEKRELANKTLEIWDEVMKKLGGAA